MSGEGREESYREKMKRLLKAARLPEAASLDTYHASVAVKPELDASSSSTDVTSQEAKEDYDQLRELLRGTTVCDYKILDKTAETVKQFLFKKSVDWEKYERLLKIEEYVPFVVKCLKAESVHPSLQANAAWMFKLFVLRRNKAQVQIREACAKGAVPSLLKLLNPSLENAVLEEVATAIAFVAKNSDTRSQVTPASISNKIFDYLVKIINKKDPPPSERLLKLVSILSRNMLLGAHQAGMDAIARGELPTTKDLRSTHPSPSVVKAALPVISLILDLDTKDVVILENMLQSICMCLTVLDNLDPFLETNGLPNKFISYLKVNLESDEYLAGITAALGTVAATGYMETWKFLNTLKDTDGLENFWRCIKLNEKENLEGMNMIQHTFIDTIDSLIHLDHFHVATKTVIKSGAAHALANILHHDCPRDFLDSAIIILGRMAADLPRGVKPIFIEMDLLPHAVKLLKTWKTSNQNAVRGACSIISMVVEYSQERRDEALSLGLVPILFDIIGHRQNVITEIGTTYNALEVLFRLLQVKPKSSLEPYKGVQKVMINLFSAVSRISADDIDDFINPAAVAVDCLLEIIEYGQEGIDVIFTTARLGSKMISHLYSAREDMKELGIKFILRLCQLGNAQHRRSLLDMGALHHFKGLLWDPMNNTRKMALECLLIILDDELKSSEKGIIERLKPSVLAESKRNISLTTTLSRAVYHKMIA